MFGAMYFIQGIGEPTEGLIAQPVRSLLAKWGLNYVIDEYLPQKLAREGVSPEVPWLYNFKIDFRFK